MSNDPFLNESDFESWGNEANKFQSDVSLMDAMSAGFNEGLAAGPTAAIANWISSTGSTKFKGAELNEKYGISDTPVAFGADEDVTDSQAKRAANRYFEQQANNIKMQQVDENFGAVGTLANFAGSIGSGLVDPTNLAVGVGTAVAMGRIGLTSSASVLSNVAARKSVSGVVGRQLAENFAATVVTDAAIIPFGDEAINQQVDIETRMFNIIGGTMFGTVLGSAGDVVAIRAARKQAHAMAEQHGSKAADIQAKANQKAAQDAAAGLKPNPDHVLHMSAVDHIYTRPHQTAYTFTEATGDIVFGAKSDTSIANQTWVIGRDLGGSLDQVHHHGDGTITLVDNYNLAHNRVESAMGRKKGDINPRGEVYQVRLNKDLNILANSDFNNIKTELSAKIRAVGKNKTSFHQKVTKLISEVEDIPSLKQGLHDIIDDFKGLPSVNDLVNDALLDMGYSGYHTIGEINTKVASTKHNSITLFDPRDKKGMMYMGSGLEGTSTSAKSFADGERLFYNKSIFSDVFDAERTTPFDPDAPKLGATMSTSPKELMEVGNGGDLATQLRDMEKAEMMRYDDPKQQLGFDEAAHKEMTNNVKTEVDDAIQNFLDTESIELEQLRNLKNLDQKYQDAFKKIDNPKRVDEAFLAYKKCFFGG